MIDYDFTIILPGTPISSNAFVPRAREQLLELCIRGGKRETIHKGPLRVLRVGKDAGVRLEYFYIFNDVVRIGQRFCCTSPWTCSTRSTTKRVGYTFAASRQNGAVVASPPARHVAVRHFAVSTRRWTSGRDIPRCQIFPFCALAD